MLPVVADFAPDNNRECADLAGLHPGISFVMNHLALPGSLDLDDQTYGGLMAGASLPNVFIMNRRQRLVVSVRANRAR